MSPRDGGGCSLNWASVNVCAFRLECVSGSLRCNASEFSIGAVSGSAGSAGSCSRLRFMAHRGSQSRSCLGGETALRGACHGNLGEADSRHWPQSFNPQEFCLDYHFVEKDQDGAGQLPSAWGTYTLLQLTRLIKPDDLTFPGEPVVSFDFVTTYKNN